MRTGSSANADLDAPRGLLRIAHCLALSLIALANVVFLAVLIGDLFTAPRQSFTPTRPAIQSPLQNVVWHKSGALA